MPTLSARKMHRESTAEHTWVAILRAGAATSLCSADGTPDVLDRLLSGEYGTVDRSFRPSRTRHSSVSQNS
jgi:hypothetical protein